MPDLREAMARSYCEAFDDGQCACAVEGKPIERWCRGPVDGTDAVLAAIEASGRAIVPLEPTKEMVDAAVGSWTTRGRIGETMANALRTALAARPRDVTPTDKKE